MPARSFITRIFEASTCVRVGSSLSANFSKLTTDGEAFDNKLKAAIEHTITLTSAIDLASRSVMQLVDRGADRSVGGLQRLVDGIISSLHQSSLALLSPDALTRLSQAERFLELAYPNSTSYLTFDYEKQWDELHQLDKALNTDEARTLTAALGIQMEVAQVLRWIAIYGKHKGITEHHEDPASKLEALLTEWHNSYEKLAEKAKGAYDQDIPEESQKRALLLSPYLDELERLRKEDRERTKQYREAKKAQPKDGE